MTRSELVEELSRKSGLSPRECDRVVRLLFDTITEHLATGEKITLSGFGTFERRMRKATFARNPQTGNPMPIRAQNVATFRAGSSLKDAVKVSS